MARSAVIEAASPLDSSTTKPKPEAPRIEAPRHLVADQSFPDFIATRPPVIYNGHTVCPVFEYFTTDDFAHSHNIREALDDLITETRWWSRISRQATDAANNTVRFRGQGKKLSPVDEALKRGHEEVASASTADAAQTKAKIEIAHKTIAASLILWRRSMPTADEWALYHYPVVAHVADAHLLTLTVRPEYRQSPPLTLYQLYCKTLLTITRLQLPLTQHEEIDPTDRCNLSDYPAIFGEPLDSRPMVSAID